MIRKAIRSQWSVRPMEEWGVGPLREKEGLWDELFISPWDRRVKIHNMAFTVPNEEVELPNRWGLVVSLSFEFGPETKLALPDGSGTYGDIGRVVSFKVFDSQGELNGFTTMYCVPFLPDTFTRFWARIQIL
jgi:hypothetical protein